MNNRLGNLTTIFTFSILMIILIITRSHSADSFVHLADSTLVSLIIAGVYFRHYLSPIILISIAVIVDNYAIFYQGVSANCITPAYSFLPLLYFLVYYFSKYITSLAINSVINLFKVSTILFSIISLEWLLATVSYYMFTNMLWADFYSYISKWFIIEVTSTIYYLIAIITIFSFINYLILKLKSHSA